MFSQSEAFNKYMKEVDTHLQRKQKEEKITQIFEAIEPSQFKKGDQKVILF